jgi:hypothetical protein
VMDWLPEALPENGSGIWMYHGRDHGRGPASWFIVAKAQSYMITRWTEAASAYWKTHDTVKEYFWMDPPPLKARFAGFFYAFWHANYGKLWR